MRREHDFARVDNEGRLIQGSIDRVVLLYDGEIPVAADIIDFKTDAEIIGAADRHRDQLEAYRNAASQVFKIDPQNISPPPNESSKPPTSTRSNSPSSQATPSRTTRSIDAWCRR